MATMTTAGNQQSEQEPTTTDLAAYLDALARHRRRLVDDIHAARVRLARATHERRARTMLGERDAEQLELLGILGPPADELDDLRVVDERRAQLAALDRLREISLHARDHAPDTRDHPGHQAA